MLRNSGLKILRTTDPNLFQKKWTSFLFLKISSKRKSKAVLLFMLKFPFSVYLYFIHLKKCFEKGDSHRMLAKFSKRSKHDLSKHKFTSFLMSLNSDLCISMSLRCPNSNFRDAYQA